MGRRIFVLVTACVLLLTWLPLGASAAGTTATLTGPGTVRAGDTVTVTLQINGSNISGVSGTLAYDTNQVTFSGTKSVVAAPWLVEFNGNNFVAYDNNLTNPINGQQALFTATFKVKSNVAVGTAVKISATQVKASDGTGDTNLGTVSYTKTVAPPLSGNNQLASLTVGNGDILPAFNPDVTDYTVKVPFGISKLEITAGTADSKAGVQINQPNLVPGGTTQVTVTVTAENGSVKTYTLAVTREADPNYVPSANNELGGISVEGFLLSPIFKSEQTEYVVWLPYETDRITVSGVAADSKASVEVVGGTQLAAGQDNVVQVICTAEDGTQKVYTVIAKRAPDHDGSADPKPTTIPKPETPTPVATDAGTPSPVQEGFAWYWLVIAIAAALCVGLAVGYVIPGKKK